MPDNDYFEIQGGVPLRGSVTISGSKNAALPILCACVLAEDKCRIDNLPYIEDIQRILEILSQLGAGITDLGGGSIEIDSRDGKQAQSILLYARRTARPLRYCGNQPARRLRDRSAPDGLPYQGHASARCGSR